MIAMLNPPVEAVPFDDKILNARRERIAHIQFI